ncbi:NEAT domain-containing protein [Cohnella hashimotonis]|uniref:NEAT domain-containing protein n=1 Tax=Cohnella hashimotonis TaxID=2826895 RepID=A0ABT6TJG5_9BACL|nr:NEAT domain-containing protein [Cohnella hashimotonis]MDI4646976.1 NEAT domain-containing protein [Cohnella hashimotonis]
MKTRIRKWALVALAALLLLSLPQLGTAAGSTVTVKDGEYTGVPYKYLKDGTTATSAANEFMWVEHSGRLVVSNGKTTFYHKVPSTSADWIVYLAYRKTGHPKATISGNVVTGMEGYQPFSRSSGGQPEVSAELEQGADSVDVLMHIVVPGINYDNWYNAQLKFDAAGLPTETGGEPGGESPSYTLEQLNAQISAAQAVYGNAVVGDAYGQYPSNSKALFHLQIGTAQDKANNPSASPAEISSAYVDLTNAIDTFKASVKQADKTELREAIAKVQALFDKVQAAGIVGTADAASRAALNGDADPDNDVDTYRIPVVAAGEYHKDAQSMIASALTSAKTTLDTVTATDTTVASRVKTLNSRLTLYTDYFYRLNPEPLPIYVLDNPTSATAQSEYASEFAGVAYQLYNGVDSTKYANVPMKLSVAGAAYMSVAANTGYTMPTYDEYADYFKAVKLLSFADYSNTVFQLQSHSYPNSDGISYLRYFVGGQERAVYISYNYKELNGLQTRIAAAQVLHDKAASSGGAYKQDKAARDALQAAITEARATGDNLASIYKNIVSADGALEDAVVDFLQSAAYATSFTAADAARDDFSPVAAYLDGKADITTVSGVSYAEFTIKNSSKVTAVRFKNGAAFVDAEQTGADASNDTRRVKIAISDPAALTAVQIVADSTAYDVRLNWSDVDNKALAAKVAAAKSELAAAVVGTAAGQYPASAKTTLEQAVAAAGKEATRLAGTQALSDAAVQKLDDAIKTFRSAVHGSGGNPGTGTELTDGKYQISFTILKHGTQETSVMDEYVAHPGRLLVENGTKYVYIWLKQSKEITSFTVNGSSAETVSSDAAGNTRWVRFPASDLTALQNGWVKIDWPEVNYFHQYDVQIRLGSYTKVAEWSGEGFGSVTPRPNPDGEDEQSGTGGGNANGGGNSGGTDENPGAEFFDTAKHWAAASISRAVKLGIVNGYSDGNFRPNAAISRVEFAVMLGRALDLQGDEAELSFKDAADIRPWAQSFIKQAVASGIIGGFEDGTFRPAKEISRPELAVMIVRALGIAPETNASLAFADASQIPAYARPYVAAAVKLGLIQGGSNNLFGAKSPATRAEAITLALRALDYAEANAKAKAETGAKAETDAKAKTEAAAAGAKTESEAAKS